MVTWRGREHLPACLDALAAQERPHRTLVVDNGSADGTARVLAEHPSRPDVLRLPRNLGYAGGIAAALAQVRTPFTAWLNDDAAPEPGWLAALEDALDADPGAWAASSLLRGPGGRVQSLGVRLTADGHGADLGGLDSPDFRSADRDGADHDGADREDADHDGADPADPDLADPDVGGPHLDVPELDRIPPGGAVFEVFGFCGGAALTRTARVRAVGGVPAGFFCYYEDTDTSWRLRLAGGRVLAVPAARAIHRHGASSEPGSARFHRWNERNRLLALLRCAPGPVAAGQLARFAALTLALIWRRGQQPPNFRVALRLRVLAEVCAALPAALRARRRFHPARRAAVWQHWAG